MAKREENKTRQFEIPKNFIGTFFTQLEETELNYELIDIDEDNNNDLIIAIEYSTDEREEVMNLIELLDEYLEGEEEETEENENN